MSHRASPQDLCSQSREGRALFMDRLWNNGRFSAWPPPDNTMMNPLWMTSRVISIMSCEVLYHWGMPLGWQAAWEVFVYLHGSIGSFFACRLKIVYNGATSKKVSHCCVNIWVQMQITVVINRAHLGILLLQALGTTREKNSLKSWLSVQIQ